MPGHEVGRARPAGRQAHAHFAGRARKAVGHVRRALLVPDENVLDVVAIENGVVDRQHGPAGIAEDMRHPFLPQTLQQNLRS